MEKNIVVLRKINVNPQQKNIKHLNLSVTKSMQHSKKIKSKKKKKFEEHDVIQN